MKPFVHFLSVAVLCVACLLGGCGDNPRATALLSRADSLMASRPDSALLLLDSLLTDSDRLSTHFVMQCRLRRLNACNKLDTVFTAAHVALARALADHFDDRGTPNEQMLAYYLLGRTYADAGEAPRAIEAYNTAADRADTIATDCDYKTLCRVYAQMSDIYYYQNLYEDQLVSLDRATYYGYLAKDTLAGLLAYAHKSSAYKLLQKPNSMLIVCETASRLFLDAGYSSNAADVLGIPIRYLCDQDSLFKAKKYIDFYERKSGFFDERLNIEHGREVYYYTKGYYYLKTCQYDSAEYFFRKELATGKDFNNQNAGAHGLSLLFQQTHKPDSAAKYALYSYEMNDSVYAHKATEEVAKTKALYDYTRYEKDAQQSKLHAIRAQLRFVITAVIALLILILAMLIAYRYREVQKKRQEEKLHYQQLLDSHGRTEKELSELRAHQGEQTLKELITQKEQELARLDAELAHYRRKSELMTEASSDEERLLRAFPFYQNLLYTTDQGHSLTANDWKTIRKFLQEHLPQFYRYMSDNCRDLTNYEYQVCLLVRLHLKPKSIANALGVDGSYVTRVRRSMVKKLFGVDVSSKEADMLVLQIDRLKATEAAD